MPTLLSMESGRTARQDRERGPLSARSPGELSQRNQNRERSADDNTSVGVLFLKDKSLTDLDNLPEPDGVAEEIIENLEAGQNRFREDLVGLEKIL